MYYIDFLVAFITNVSWLETLYVCPYIIKFCPSILILMLKNNIMNSNVRCEFRCIEILGVAYTLLKLLDALVRGKMVLCFCDSFLIL